MLTQYRWRDEISEELYIQRSSCTVSKILGNHHDYILLSVQEGLTPLMVAVTNSNPELVGILISHGADVNCSRVC